MLDQTKIIYTESYGPDDPDQVELLLARARILERSNRTQESRRNCLAASALQDKIDRARTAQDFVRQACAKMQPEAG